MKRTFDVVDDCILLLVVLKYVFALVNVFLFADTDADGATDSDVEVDDDDGSIVRAFSSMIN